jgi:hypothetical protein
MYSKLSIALLIGISFIVASSRSTKAEQPEGYYSPTGSSFRDYTSKTSNALGALDACFILFTKKTSDGTTAQYAIDKQKYRKGNLPTYNRIAGTLANCSYDQKLNIETCGEVGSRWYSLYESANGFSYFQFMTEDYDKLIQAVSLNNKKALDIVYLQRCPFEKEMASLTSEAEMPAESPIITMSSFSSGEWDEFKKMILDHLSRRR